jgi:predicted small integral membrane protein
MAGHSPSKTGVNALLSRPSTSCFTRRKDVDARHKAGHDGGEVDANEQSMPEMRMIVVRAAKIAMVAAIALFATIVAFGNITDYGTNLAFVQHVLSMDTIFERSTIRYRAITSPALHHLAYALIIATEALTAVLCWIGAIALLRSLRADGRAFNRAKAFAVAGLTLGFLLWQLGFMTIGGEWFGMWQSKSWDGVPSAFRFVMVIMAVLIFVVLPDGEVEPR